MATIEGTLANIEQIIDANEVVIVDFWAPWCAPCRTFAPVFESASEEHPDIKFIKVNTEDQPQLASEFQIQAIPTLVVFRDQIGLFSQSGALPPAALGQVIEQIKKLDMDEVRAKLNEEQPPN